MRRFEIKAVGDSIYIKLYDIQASCTCGRWDSEDYADVSAFLTVDEALTLAEELLRAARAALAKSDEEETAPEA